PVPKPRKANTASLRDELELPPADAKPSAPATAGRQRRPVGTDARAKEARGKRGRHAGASAADVPASAPVTSTKERLFAHPERPAAYAAGGQRQLAELGQPL